MMLSHWLGEAQEKSDLHVNVVVDPDSGNLTVASYVPLEEDLCPSHSSLYLEGSFTRYQHALFPHFL